ncbi:glycosyltransferase family 8 protein [Vagococcus sp. WN89Y]|uniref:glycosyltransferase family 8 protein n=1 Tax=Vagococcus sp. WN89Y TaxID=3457258 RepID=UPI003FCE83CE
MKLNVSTENIFKSITILNERLYECSDRETFNVSWGVDKNYQLGAAISIASILEYNKKHDFTFHVISDEFSGEYIEHLIQLAKQYNTVIKLYKIDDKPLQNLPKTNIWPISIYYRLISFDYFSDKLNALLYLDADIICKNDITELFSFDFQGNYGAVVKDVDSMQKKSAERLNNPEFDGYYFNSGVMYINLIAWQNENLTERIFNLLLDDDVINNLKYPDQDVLNLILLGHLYYLPRKYNTVFTLKSEFEVKNSEYYKQVINDDTIFIHYTGITKPWHDWADYHSSAYFRRVYNLTPWNKDPLVSATKIFELKEKYKHQLYQGKFIKGLLTAFKYNLKKISK